MPLCIAEMGQSQSTETALKVAVAAGFAYAATRVLLTSFDEAGKQKLTIPTSPIGNDSFVSMESAEGSELDGEIERAAEFISNIKWLMETHPGKKRQLEESLSRAESSFNNLFELKSKLEQYETTGMILGSQVSSEIAKSAAQRDIEERLLFSGFGKGSSGIIGSGDNSPFKRQRTHTS